MKYYWRAIKRRPLAALVAIYFFVRQVMTMGVPLADATFGDVFMMVAGTFVVITHSVEIGRAAGKEKTRDQEAEERNLPPH